MIALYVNPAPHPSLLPEEKVPRGGRVRARPRRPARTEVMIVKRNTIFLVALIQIIILNGCLPSIQKHELGEGITPASDLLVDISAFPDGWSRTSCDSSLCDGDDGINTAGQDYFVKGKEGHVYEEVYRLGNSGAALKKYEVYFNGDSKESVARKPYVEFQKPIGIPFVSSLAEKSSLLCGVDIIPKCRFYAVYSNYFVYLFFNHAIELNDGGLTDNEIDNVLNSLEQKIALINLK